MGDQGGQVVAIDLLPVESIPGVDFIQLDFMDPTAPERLKRMLRGGKADVVLSDMAAQGTGHARTDHLRIVGLAEAAAEFACEVLEVGGAFVCKVFQGGSERALLDLLKRAFATVKHVKPPASRAEIRRDVRGGHGVQGDGAVGVAVRRPVGSHGAARHRELPSVRAAVIAPFRREVQLMSPSFRSPALSQ